MLVARSPLPVGVGLSRTLGEGLQHLCSADKHKHHELIKCHLMLWPSLTNRQWRKQAGVVMLKPRDKSERLTPSSAVPW